MGYASAQRDDFTTILRPSEGGRESADGIEEKEEREEETDEDGNRDDDLQDNASALSSEPHESISAFCLRTGIEFPSSGYMKLMAVYDDGLSPAVSSSPIPTESIFCRICREGIHDDADDEPSAVAGGTTRVKLLKRRRPTKVSLRIMTMDLTDMIAKVSKFRIKKDLCTRTQCTVQIQLRWKTH